MAKNLLFLEDSGKVLLKSTFFAKNLFDFYDFNIFNSVF